MLRLHSKSNAADYCANWSTFLTSISAWIIPKTEQNRKYIIVKHDKKINCVFYLVYKSCCTKMMSLLQFLCIRVIMNNMLPKKVYRWNTGPIHTVVDNKQLKQYDIYCHSAWMFIISKCITWMASFTDFLSNNNFPAFSPFLIYMSNLPGQSMFDF